MRLALIRHAEPQAALDAVVAGPNGCTGLSDLGRKQAELLAACLARAHGLRADVVLTSALRRAVETAVRWHRCWGRRPNDVICVSSIPARVTANRGTFTATGTRRRPTQRVHSPTPARACGAFDERVRRTLLGVLDEHAGSDVLIVAHCGVIEAVTLLLLGLPGLAEVRPSRIDALWYTSITEWTGLADDGRWRLDRYNDHAHLLERT